MAAKKPLQRPSDRIAPRWASMGRQAATGANAGGWSQIGDIRQKKVIAASESASDSGGITGCIMHPMLHPLQKPNKKRVRRSSVNRRM